MTNYWHNTDPRHEIYKRATIVILIPITDKKKSAFMGEVETKNEWCVFTDYPERQLISADDQWPEHWLWIYSPDNG